MKLSILSIAFVATLLAVAEAKKGGSNRSGHGHGHNKGGNSEGGSSGSGQGAAGSGTPQDSQKARALAGPLIDWDGAKCDTGPGPKDRFGCCNLPSASEFSNGWSVEVLGPMDDFCLMYRLNPTTRNINRKEIAYVTPFCLGNGESEKINWSHDRIQRFDPNPYKRSGMWAVELIYIPTTEGENDPIPAFTPDYVKADVGAAWLARDCPRLARQIKEGRVQAPPHNRFAVQARAGKVEGQATASDEDN